MVWSVSPAGAADATLKVTAKEPPAEIGESIKRTLDPKAIQLLDGDEAIYEFWFQREIPAQAEPESASKGLKTLDEITLMGVVSVGEGQRDYKDNEIIPGVYTMRFGLQPQDGDHLGTSDYPFFAVLIPAKADAAPDAIKAYKAMVRASGKATTAGHPAVLSLLPVSRDGSKIPTLTTPAPDHKAIQLRLPIKAPNSTEASSIVFELVYEGRHKG